MIIIIAKFEEYFFSQNVVVLCLIVFFKREIERERERERGKHRKDDKSKTVPEQMGHKNVHHVVPVVVYHIPNGMYL